MKCKAGIQGKRRRRGSALVLAILVSVVITGLVITLAWAGGVQAEMTSNLKNVDQATYAAETGLQRVAWYCKNGKLGSVSQPLNGVIGGYNYSATWVDSGGTVAVTSLGSRGNISSTLKITVAPPNQLPAPLTLAGDFNGKNITITGDVAVAGTYDSGGNGKINGNLTYGVANNGTVSGTATPGAFQPLQFSTMEANLVGTAGASNTLTGDQNNHTFDFSTMTGTNKVIYVKGNVSNPSFNGSGTLYVDGTVTNVGALGANSFTPVNIVATGDISTNNNITVYGSLFTPGTWNRGKIHLTGDVYAGQITSSNSGSSSVHLTQVTQPWFVVSTTTFSGFSGILP